MIAFWLRWQRALVLPAIALILVAGLVLVLGVDDRDAGQPRSHPAALGATTTAAPASGPRSPRATRGDRALAPPPTTVAISPQDDPAVVPHPDAGTGPAVTGGPPAKGGTSPAHEVAPPVERSTGAADAVADPAGPGQATPDEQAAAPSPEQQATRSEGQLSAPTGGVDGAAGPGQAAPDERGAAPAGQEPQIGTFDVAPPQPVAVPAPVSDVPGPAGAPLAPTATPGSAGSANEPGPASSGLETEAAGPSQPTSPGLQPGGPNLGVPTTTAETTTPVATAPTPPPAEPLALQPGGPRLGSPLGNAVVHDFGHVAVGATSSPLVVEVSNSRSYPVEVRAVTTPGSPAFVIGDDTCTGATLASGATCRLSVTFAPQGPGVATSAVDLTLRHTCSSTEYFPCSWVPAEIQTGVPNFTSTPGPSGLPIIDWTAAVGTGQASLEVKGEAP